MINRTAGARLFAVLGAASLLASTSVAFAQVQDRGRTAGGLPANLTVDPLKLQQEIAVLKLQLADQQKQLQSLQQQITAEQQRSFGTAAALTSLQSKFATHTHQLDTDKIVTVDVMAVACTAQGGPYGGGVSCKPKPMPSVVPTVYGNWTTSPPK